VTERSGYARLMASEKERSPSPKRGRHDVCACQNLTCLYLSCLSGCECVNLPTVSNVNTMGREEVRREEEGETEDKRTQR
jgi:hypothetical protein